MNIWKISIYKTKGSAYGLVREKLDQIMVSKSIKLQNN